MAPTAQSLEPQSVTARLSKIRMAGDLDRFSREVQGSTRDFNERLNDTSGCRLPNLGCGTDRFALIAGGEGLEVASGDLAGNWAAALRVGGAITHGTPSLKRTRTERSTALWPLLYCRSPCRPPKAELNRYGATDPHVYEPMYL
ncbi:MAG TPA: hypothetical protein VKP13_00175 [Nitrospira sp.]|nr:hypothetical protein [Nitrospira sp.]